MPEMPDYTLLISSCEAYSDLWEGNLTLLERNWKSRRARAVLVTDRETKRTFPGVEILSAGVDTPFTHRLAAALEGMDTEYVLFTLDDYFLTRPIREEKLDRAIEVMGAFDLDYLRLYPRPESCLRREGAKPCPGYPGFYLRSLEGGDYLLSLYPGLWRREFMLDTLKHPLDPWQYEVALTAMARERNAKCGISCNGELPFLDVIRKGKLLRQAKHYLERDPVCVIDRPVMSPWAEGMLTLRTWLRRRLPRPAFLALKRVLRKFGFHFYSGEEGKP